MQQLARYVSGLEADRRADLGDDGSVRWKGVLTDGNMWYFCSDVEEDVFGTVEGFDTAKRGSSSSIRSKLSGFIDPELRAYPPVEDQKWVTGLAEPFAELADKASKNKRLSIGLEAKRQLWADLLAGSHMLELAESDSDLAWFVQHTMLVLLARLVRCEIVDSQVDVTEGFPVWVVECGGQQRIDDLQAEISLYNWRAGRDVLKDLYHTAIPTEVRHGFGEYYTPDWLAEAVVEEVCDSSWVSGLFEQISNDNDILTPQVIDPSCGSGTFLFAAVKLLASESDRLSETNERLSRKMRDPENKAKILNRLVGGIDLHPIAVELAQTTKLMALGTDPGETLHVCLGDSMQWNLDLPAQQTLGTSTLDIKTSTETITLPVCFVEDSKYHERLKFLFTAVESDSSKDEETVKNIAVSGEKTEMETLENAIMALRKLKTEGRNGVWQWFLDNIAQPYRLSLNQPTRLVGNPPWLAYRDMAVDRQKEFIEKAKARGIWSGGNYGTVNNLAGLFVAVVVDLYLLQSGKFGFVMPDSVLVSELWDNFLVGEWSDSKSHRKCSVSLTGGWDLTKVKDRPFESSDSCTIFGFKSDTADMLSEWELLTGKGITVYSEWQTIASSLSRKPVERTVPQAKQAYEGQFKQGASLVPQSLVLAPEVSKGSFKGTLKFTTKTGGKPPWVGPTLGSRSGEVEQEFVFNVIRSSNLLPFRITGNTHLIAPLKDGKIMPIKNLPDHMKMYWLTAEQAWQEGRTGKSENKALVEYLNERNKLLRQYDSIESGNCRIVYNHSGTSLRAAVTTCDTLADATLNYFTTGKDEAHYLAAILNARCLQDFIATKCQSSRRHFSLKPIKQLPVPLFDMSNKQHQKLADLSAGIHLKATEENLVSEQEILAHPRIISSLAAIDNQVKTLFTAQYWN